MFTEKITSIYIFDLKVSLLSKPFSIIFYQRWLMLLKKCTITAKIRKTWRTFREMLWVQCLILGLPQTLAVYLCHAVNHIGSWLLPHWCKQQGQVRQREVMLTGKIASLVLDAHHPGNVSARPTDVDLGPAGTPTVALVRAEHTLVLALTLYTCSHKQEYRNSSWTA